MDAKKKTIRNWLAVIVTVVFFAFQMYLALVKQLNPMLQSPLHLILALTLVFLYNPADKAYRKKVTKAAEAEGKPVDEKKLNAHAWMNWFDILLFICLAYMLWYVVGQNARLLDFVSVQPVYGIDYIFMVMTIVLLLIAVYRTLGDRPDHLHLRSSSCTPLLLPICPASCSPRARPSQSSSSSSASV